MEVTAAVSSSVLPSRLAQPSRRRRRSHRLRQGHRAERRRLRLRASIFALAAATGGFAAGTRLATHGADTRQVTTLSAAAPAVTAHRVVAAGPPVTPGGKAVTGRPVDTDFGPMQVRITVANGRITATRAIQVTSAGVTSKLINQRSLPILYRETITAQNAHVDSVSGATVTSGGYKQALQSAIDAAHLA